MVFHTAGSGGNLCLYRSGIIYRESLENQGLPAAAAPAKLSETLDHPLVEDRPISVDVFFPTYNEEEDLVRLSIRDAKRLEYPFSIDIKIHVLDDGKRKTMQLLAAEEGVNYITRDNNAGFKAGNTAILIMTPIT